MKPVSWVILFFAIVFEVAGTLTLKFTEGMTRLLPTVLMFAFYLVSLFGLSVAVSKIPVGTAYAVWSGVGTLMVALLGVFWLKEEVTVLRSVSMMLIVIGVAGLYLTGSHQ
ncbi:MAG: multidrug efflux SMR transporter [Acidobacteriia bacterium]|nr:multidrug efflux SMR transporter [Terriglobia bacterium]